MTPKDAILGFAVAFLVAVVMTPVTARVARVVGAIDRPKDRGLAAGGTPLLGGLAMLAGILVSAAFYLHSTPRTEDRVHGILWGAVVIAVVGALDDRFELHPAAKLAGQIVAAVIPVHAGVEVVNITLPFVGALQFHSLGSVLTVVGLVAVMNVVNLSDGIDGLAAGVCAIAATVFAIIAFDLERRHAGVLAALTAGAALGFLVHNFHPASVFMGDCGSNLLGLMLGCIAVEGAVKTQAVLALVFPLLVLAVPFLDTTFVVLKRMKYGRPVWQADANHLHHRFNRIGFSQRRSVLYLYAWTMTLGAFAVALRFVPYSDNHGHFNTGWSLVMAALGLVVLAASVYLVVVLEILKVKRLVWMRHASGHDEAAVDAEVEQALATGEFPAVRLD
ncbi:undecaprenyl/decaprenyl-phosphate alpha-N-acetylglucosaminyl 1-phosphate transferase [Paraconexibacter antarcticus]|uniref:Undecaprenyl/decaprenyl-phosphate alpha-N-acetylglucosaminyl 1-phosphate transferase n=1 Tax=Paraconexibacter antarcticus TaxID=2949664 RepID=A0ABY5DWG7_9ACTN|nr:MraY family glycosyltransferase [Paraconexibacter antarcticus]UTI65830.1 undecaprenyl/decaprenyl-phosphate alpha-N-acetylglucosaminyl 1-phosphate transferase [Paraconexibacter antarcticus]